MRDGGDRTPVGGDTTALCWDSDLLQHHQPPECACPSSTRVFCLESVRAPLNSHRTTE